MRGGGDGGFNQSYSDPEYLGQSRRWAIFL